MKAALPILCLMILSACATPRQQCIQDATRDLQTVDRLIIETRQNIDRGFAIRQETVPRVGFNYCFGSHRSSVGLSFCSGTSTAIRETPVAIDLDAERAKLADLESRRPDLAARSQAGLAQCEAQFPT